MSVNIRVIIFLGSMLLILLFGALGCWQIARGHEKEILIAREKVEASAVPIKWTQEFMPRNFQRMEIEGQFIPQVFLLDNQHYNHQFGYDVILPLITSAGIIVLVDEGFVAGDPTRRVFPEVRIPADSVTIVGKAYFPSAKGVILGPLYEQRGEALTILERLDVEIVAKLLQKNIAPYIMRHDAGKDAGYVREWPVVSMPPARHFGYAVQWFALAGLTMIILMINLLGLNFTRRHEKA